ncbi:MAG: thioredoxin family protein [Bacteroidota bacterium]
MSILKEKDKEIVRERFAHLRGKVKLINFSQEIDCDYCGDTRALLQDVSELSEKISFESYNYIIDKDKVAQFRIDKVPATVVVGEEDYGIRFYGIPAGYEFASLLETIEMIANNEQDLSEETIEKIRSVSSPVKLQIFVTPTCPYCPPAVMMAHKLSMLNPMITSEMIEATEFPELSAKFNVHGVPRVVINERGHFEGALPEEMFVERVLENIREEIIH